MSGEDHATGGACRRPAAGSVGQIGEQMQDRAICKCPVDRKSAARFQLAAGSRPGLICGMQRHDVALADGKQTLVIAPASPRAPARSHSHQSRHAARQRIGARRIGDVVPAPPDPGSARNARTPSCGLAHFLGQLRLEVAEVGERLRRVPLLAHEQHRRRGRQQQRSRCAAAAPARFPTIWPRRSPRARLPI